MIRRATIALGAAILFAALARADDRIWLPTGQWVTPTAAPESSFVPLAVDLPAIGKAIASGGMTTLVSPDGHTLFVLTGGFNGWEDASGKPALAASTQHLFVYDISAGTPKLTQDVFVPDSWGGIAIAPDGKSLFVTGGENDNVRFFRADPNGTWSEDGKAVAFGHATGNGLVKIPGLLKPTPAGAALTADGKTLVVANFSNDSIAVVDVAARTASELDLRPGKEDPAQKGIPGGEFPYWVTIKGNDTAYVSSERDREIDVVTLAPVPHVTVRIPVSGNPNRLVLDKAQVRLFVASDNSDRISVIDTATNKVTNTFSAGVPEGYGPNARLPGAAPNSLAFSPDEKTLYVTDGGINAVGVIDLSAAPRLVGLIPTAWQPNSVSVSADGKTLYVANAKGPAGPNPHNCMRVTNVTPMCSESDMRHAANQYILQHTTGGLTTIPVPDADTLKRLTADVADNNRYREVPTRTDVMTMAGLRKHIRHIIYIVKENRTYDQILGDLKGTDGDPALVQFGPDVTANEHAIARDFVALDAFFDSGEVSGNGWQWSTAARETDYTEKAVPFSYAERGLSDDSEGDTRAINVAVPIAVRTKVNPVNDPDPDLLPGPLNQAEPDGPNGEIGEGFIWNAVLRAHESVRNYGFFVDIVRYDQRVPAAYRIPVERDAFGKGLVVATATNAALMNLTDRYFRGFDNQLPDLYRYREWEREFSGYEKNGDLPRFEMVRLMHDHTGDFKSAIDGVNTPETQIADNDYAVGLLVQRVAHSRFRDSTLVFVIEDDAQDGPDHVDAHRSIAFVAGPYVKHHAVVSERYNTVNMVATMEDLLGVKPLNFHDANARPMTAVFDLKNAKWSYEARVPEMLRTTQLQLPGEKHAARITVRPLHDAAWWAKKTKGFDFSVEDRAPAVLYDRVLWQGTKGTPYPTTRDGRIRRPG